MFRRVCALVMLLAFVATVPAVVARAGWTQAPVQLADGPIPAPEPIPFPPVLA
jgi:hypothetical protein